MLSMRTYSSRVLILYNLYYSSALLVFVLSAANSDLYIGSRTLYGLALEGKAPSIFRRVSSRGLPYPALFFCTAWCFLAFLGLAQGPAKGMARSNMSGFVAEYHHFSFRMVCEHGFHLRCNNLEYVYVYFLFWY